VAAAFNRQVRSWLATAAVILLILLVWKFIDYRMQAPPPPSKTTQAGTP
jgi:hypothetical protein